MIKIKFNIILIHLLLIIVYYINVVKSLNINETLIEKRENCKDCETRYTNAVPIKYWTEKQRKLNKEKNKDKVNVNLRSDTTISTFTKFYDQLNTLEKKIYDGIYSASIKSPPDSEAKITDTNSYDINKFASLLEESVERVFTVIMYEHPELWWIGPINQSLSTSRSSNQYKHTLTFNLFPTSSKYKTYTSAQIVSLSKRIDVIKKDIMKKIATLNLTSDYAKLKYIHDYLITKIIYYLDENKKHIRNVYGAMVENKCVCEGYAEAFQLIAHEYNIDVIIARSAEHEWNFAKVKNKWYVVDVTWDDPTINDSDEPSGSYSNLYDSYFLIGTSNSEYTESYSAKEHKLIYSAFSDTNKVVKYPVIETKDYIPTSSEKNEAASSTKFGNSYISTELIVPNCGINASRKTIKCPTTFNYLCISGDNEIYKSGGSTCSKTYTNSSKKYVITLKDTGGYKDYSNDSVTSSSKFMIYDCGKDDVISTGCIVYTDEYYMDTTNKRIYHLDSDDYYKQLMGTTYHDDKANKDYLCDANGICSISNNSGYYLAGTANSDGSYSKLIKCTSSSCSSAASPTVNGFYVNGANSGKSLIECQKTSSSPSCKVSVDSSNIKKTGYAYLDAGNDNSSSSSYGGIIICTGTVCTPKSKPTNSDILYYINGGVSTDKDIIQCNKTSCKSTTATPTKGYAYVDGSTPGNVLLGNGSKFVPTASGASTSTSKYYIDASNNKQIVTCGYDTLSSKVLCTQGSSGASASKDTYFTDGGIPGNIIKCTTSSCTSQTTYPGYYLNSSTTYPLLKCTSQSKGISCQQVSKNNVKVGYYLDASSTTDGTSYSRMIYCSTSTNCSPITTANKGYYIDGSGQLIKSNGSKYTLVTDINKGYYLDGSSTSDGTTYTQVINCTSSSSCTTVKTKYPGYYLDGSSAITVSSRKKRSITTTYSKLIVCDGNSYSTYTSTIHVGQYLDGDSTTNGTTYKKLISCTSSTSCTSISTSVKGFYLDASSTNNNSSYSKLIIHDGTSYSSLASINIGYYLSGISSTNGQSYTSLIYCSSTSSCRSYTNIYEGFYYEGSTATGSNYIQLISCTIDSSDNPSCKMHDNVSHNPSHKPFEGYYINGMNDVISYPLIYCDSQKCVKQASNAINPGYYFEGSTCKEDGKKYTKFITCNVSNGKASGCKVKTPINGNYLNGESTTFTNAIINCSNSVCERITPTASPSYYVGVNDELNGLIICGDPKTSSSKCELKSAFTSQGYYLNSGKDNKTKQLITCDSTEGCKSINSEPGYYVNTGDIKNNPIIKCSAVGSACTVENKSSCPATSNAVVGDYCYEDGILKFFPENSEEAVYATTVNDYYAYVNLKAGKFPGVTKDENTVIKVSVYYIVQYNQGGVITIDNTGKLVETLDPDQPDAHIYDCSNAINGCTEIVRCTSNTYMYDSENKKAVFCNNGSYEHAEFTGYVVSNNVEKGKNKYPYLIKCENNGETCSNIKPTTNTYYENNGFDSSKNSLIICNDGNCYTLKAETGNYIAYDGAGIIECSSSTSCKYKGITSNVKYINNGFDSHKYGLISCTKNDGCSTAPGKEGYYLSSSSSILIHCTGPSNCEEVSPTAGHYDYADAENNSNMIINCSGTTDLLTCSLVKMSGGFYLTNKSNILIRCKSNSKCTEVVVENGIFRGALKKYINKRSLDSQNEIKEEVYNNNNINNPSFRVERRATEEFYGLIRCVTGKCVELTIEEIEAIPVCEFNNKKCYITREYSMRKSATSFISAGDFCTNQDRSEIYFATDSIVVKPDVIAGVTSTYVYTTTNTNCLEAIDEYAGFYYTVGSSIYQIEKDSIIPFYTKGLYFINVATNTLITKKDIELYNNENVKLYKCDDYRCSIVDNPNTTTYYADVNKWILKYNVFNKQYSFPHENDITCIYENSKCTPNADLNNQEFCITYKGELALATTNIKSRETGECFKAGTINSYIYGYSQYLYSMDIYSAHIMDESGYHIVNLMTNNTVNNIGFVTSSKENNLVIYGCQVSSCEIIEPDESIYYYDKEAKTILRYKDESWQAPESSGYALVSLDPESYYIYHITKNKDEITIDGAVKNGFYYTIDKEMFYCDDTTDYGCSEIEDSGYYFTNNGEIYRCFYDSEQIEATECTKQTCIIGQYYYINNSYYRCGNNFIFSPVISRYCSYEDNVVINFPIIYSDSYPLKIKQAVRKIQKHNFSTALGPITNSRILKSVSGVFTNCTYNAEETKSHFDLVCINNYVIYDEEDNDVKICSVQQLGYVDCIEDHLNPFKCNLSSSSIHLITNPSIFTLLLIVFITIINILM